MNPIHQAALLLVAAAATAATAADPGWTGSAWTAPIAPAADNILSPSYLDEDSYAYNGLCDRVYDLSCLLHGKCDIVWNFPKPATISAINVYSGWGNTGRADIYVTSVSVKYAAGGEWIVLDNSETKLYASSIGSKVKGRYAMSDGSTLASGVVALKMTFPAQQNGYVGIYEAEVSGAFDEALDPQEFPYTFDFGDYAIADWTPSEGNMMQFCSSMSKTTITTPGNNSGIVRTTTDITSSHSHMIDRTVGTTSNRQIEPGAVVTWTFSTPFTLEAFKVFSHWNDKGRDAIVIYDFEVMDGDGVWTRLFDSSHPVLLGTTSSADLYTAAGGASGGTGHLWFALTRTDGEPIATDVAAIRVRTGSGSSYGSGWNDSFWTEVEAIGSRSGGGAVLDATSVTVTNHCWEVVWSAALASLGASDRATINLLTSLDGENFSLAGSRLATEIGTPCWFTNVFDSLEQTVWYKFETVNASGSDEWRSTNAVAGLVLHDNATYWWRGDVASGAWEDGASWSNSLSDARLAYPDSVYATADFSLVGPGSPVAVSVSAPHTVRFAWPASDASVSFSGFSSAALADVSPNAAFSGTNTFTGLALTLPKTTFAAHSRLRLAGGAAATLGAGSLLSGEGCGIEITDGATLSIRTGDHTEFCNDAEIVLDGGSVSDAGYFVWSGAASAPGGRIVFGSGGGEFISPNTHKFKATPTTPLELRYELPGVKWPGYPRAPLRLGWVNDYNQFGMGGKVFVDVEKGDSLYPGHALRIPLVDTTHDNAFIHTNGFSFAAFGTSMAAGELSPKGDRFLWTYDHDGSLAPAAPGSLPTGLVFDYAGRQSAVVIIVR